MDGLVDGNDSIGKGTDMYVLIIIQTAKDGTVTPAAYAYKTLDEAKAAYYSELAAGASGDALAYDACIVVSQTGGVVKYECVEHEAKATGASGSGATSVAEASES